MEANQVTENPLSTRNNRVIRLPMKKDEYTTVISDAGLFRAYLDDTIILYPELFPKKITLGYLMKDLYKSKKTGLYFRRITVDNTAYSVRPSFVSPYLSAWTDEASKALFLRKFGIPFWALAETFGKDSMYWYRLETSLGRFNLVTTTIKDPDLLPENIGADEKHSKCLGEKVYAATTVAEGCILGAHICGTAGNDDLKNGYSVFQQEATDMKEDYSPKTVNTDGWAATINAFQALFPMIVMIPCFLHLYIKMRDRAKIKYRDLFRQAADKLWNCYHASNKRSFSQRVRRLHQWATNEENNLPSVILNPINKLKNKVHSFSASYDHPHAHRTSNMLDRLMQRMSRHLYSAQYFHGSIASATLSIRAWALIYNFTPSNPYTVKKHGGKFRSPAERLNDKSYHDDWLHNLLISGSINGYRPPPLNPL